MKYFLDTEFYEEPGSIDLISLALVSEDDRELYLINKDFNKIKFFDSLWHIENVLPTLPFQKIYPNQPWSWANSRELWSDEDWCSYSEIKDEILEFVKEDMRPEFWGYYADYDWVVFCWLFGRMIDLPRGFPMYCRDLKQVLDELGLHGIKQTDSRHNALLDAKWIKKTYYEVMGK